jgi:hypothetical protein
MRKSLGLCLLLLVLLGCRTVMPVTPSPSATPEPMATPSSLATPTTPPMPEIGEFEGFYVSQFEVAAFKPCGQEGHVYWLGAGNVPDFWSRYQELGGKGTEVYLSFTGELSPPSPNGYGHLNQYEREVTITQLHEMSLDGKCK